MLITILDIDGTISDPSHRLKYVIDEPRDYDRFYKFAKEDIPYFTMCAMALNFIEDCPHTFFLTGRPERIRKDTLEWLNTWVSPGITDERLLMKKEQDQRPDFEAKADRINILQESLEEGFRIPNAAVLCVDDRPSVIAYLRHLDYNVIRVGNWKPKDDRQFNRLPKEIQEAYSTEY